MIHLLKFDESRELRLEQFDGDGVPDYAILSHTWFRPHGQELTFQDVMNHTGKDKAGYKKVSFCLDKAAEDGIFYCWVDTCCINKESSAELSRAINSMFRWYRNAARCYVYMSDVSARTSADGNPPPRSTWEVSFRQSRWFTRGWTLQELIAPSAVEFFSAEGMRIGDKKSLERTIFDTTGLPLEALRGAALSTFSHSERRAWGETRETTEPEDKAYCLLGILDISLGAYYGEGLEKAMARLDREVHEAAYRAQTSVLGKRQSSDHDMTEEPPRAKQARCDGEKLLDSERKATLMESLKFDQIEARQMSIRKAHVNTCQWLIKDPQYLAWLDDEAFESHRGAIWIKGKPGSGKSTIMKFALTNALRRMHDTVILSFFFNARGGDLERSVAGAYRTLLVQLLEQHTYLQSVFRILGPAMSRIGKNSRWDIETLKELLSEAFQGLRARSVICFIDALDECAESEIRDMISYFEGIGENASSNSRRMRICLASRHYPHISMKSGLSLILDEKYEHKQDIKAFLASELRIGRSSVAAGIRKEILEKASGVFIWTVLVVAILNKEYDGGRMHKLRQRLMELPSNLHSLFEEILMRDASNKDAMLACIQWILFAKMPLSPQQLYFAIRAKGEDTITSNQLETEVVEADTIDRFILDTSKGLAETTRSNHPTVQFIHESVRDFLIKENGLGRMWPELVNNVEGQCQDQLAQCCRSQLRATICGFSKELDDPPKIWTEDAVVLRKSITNAYPFLDYAVKNMLYHADKAAESGNEGRFIQSFLSGDMEDWIKLVNVLAVFQTHRYALNQSLLHILSRRGYAVLLRRELDRDGEVDEGDERHFDALWAAVEQGQEEIVRILIQHHVKLRRRELKRLEDRPFLKAVQRRDEAIITLLLDISDLGNTQNRQVINKALVEAANRGSESIVDLLLDYGADVDAQSGYFGTALQAACAEGHDRIVETLIEWGADVNAQSGAFATALQAACIEGYEEIVEMLLDRGADIDDEGGPYGTALQAACANNWGLIVEILLDRGADVNACQGFYATALDLAIYNGHDKIAEMLLSGDVDIDTNSDSYFDMLDNAREDGHEDIVRMLLERGMDPDARQLAADIDNDASRESDEEYYSWMMMEYAHAMLEYPDGPPDYDFSW